MADDLDRTDDLEEPLMARDRLDPRTSPASAEERLTELMVPSSPEKRNLLQMVREPRSTATMSGEFELMGRMRSGDPASMSSFSRVPLAASSLTMPPAAASLEAIL